MAKSNATRAEARFKQLCCLGVGGEAVMPALIDELRILIPSVSSTFFFADQHGELANVYDDSPDSPTLIQVYLEEFHNRPERLLPGFAFTESMRTQFGVLDCEIGEVDRCKCVVFSYLCSKLRAVGAGVVLVRVDLRLDLGNVVAPLLPDLAPAL